MRNSNWSLMLVIGLWAVAGCSSTVPPRDGGSDVVATDGGCALPDGRVCPAGQSCPAGDGCNTCSCGSDGRLLCTAAACPDAGGACVLPNGESCPRGERCPAGDGCNTCTCDETGQASCTEIVCPDGGPNGECILPNDARCPRNSTCPAGDGCNTCTCGPNLELACTRRACDDAGVRACSRREDCGENEVCVGQPGCAPNVCAPAGCTRDLVDYCGCDGRTFQASSTCPDRPYSHRGPCEAPPDGGRGCTTTADCPPDSVCEGMGCGTPDGTCAPVARICTADLAPFCGCDGVTFRSSSSCPGRRYRHTGECR